MPEQDRAEQSRERTSRRTIWIWFGGLFLAAWVVFLLFMTFFAADDPERIVNPEDAVTDAPAEERGGTTDTGQVGVPFDEAEETDS